MKLAVIVVVVLSYVDFGLSFVNCKYKIYINYINKTTFEARLL